jgi:hypothetical protein
MCDSPIEIHVVQGDESVFYGEETQMGQSILSDQLCYIPILERMHSDGEPTLRAFSNTPRNCLQDKITSLHSWCQGG